MMITDGGTSRVSKCFVLVSSTCSFGFLGCRVLFVLISAMTDFWNLFAGGLRGAVDRVLGVNSAGQK